MKRQQDRDSPSKTGKRSRSSAPRFEDSPREHLSPEREGRGPPPRSPSHASSVVGAGGAAVRTSTGSSSGRRPHRSNSKTRASSSGGTPERLVMLGPSRDEYSARRGNYEKEYRVLCISGINHRVSDVTVRDGVFREFKKYGEIDVKLAADGPERFAYVYFRTADDAREARHAKSKLILFDKPVFVEPIPESASGDRRGRRSSLSPELVGSFGGKVSRARGVSPTHSTSSSSSLHRRGGRRSLERNLNLPPMHPHHLPPHHHHELPPFRRDGALGPLPPLPHHDFLAPHALPPLRRHDDKKEKFPNYLHHIPPEEDDKANRTLFVGNLEVSITEPELRRIFERYGVVEDIDIKRPPPGQGNAYAFVKFLNLDMAHKSKVEMSGQYIGKFQCKIGYGKPVPTTRIWVGGLGPWTSLSHLEKEFDRFGAIKKIDFVKGDNHAYILYDSIDAAQEACKEMRGFPLGGPNKRLRVDFADAGPYNFQHQASSGGTTRPPPPPATAYPPEDDAFYRRRIDHDHPSIHGSPVDPYYYGSARDADFARWDGAYGPEYDAYYERPPRSHLDDWAVGAYGDRDRHDYGGWGREYSSWRDGGNGREWSNDQRRKRPRTPDDLRYDGAVTHRVPAEGTYRRYPRQRTPPDALPGDAPVVGRGRRRTPSPRGGGGGGAGGYRARGEAREQEMSPGWKAQVGRERRRSRSQEGGTGVERGERDRQIRSAVTAAREEKAENGRSRDPAGNASLSPMSIIASLQLPEGHADLLVNASSLSELARVLPCTWQGGLVLKNSYFPIRMHACEGSAKLVETLTKDSASGDTQVLRITQRLRLDQPKLDDVTKRLSSGSFCILLGMATSSVGDDQTQVLAGGLTVQQRPLRNLVSYLKQKEAAGVIALSGSKDMQGVLYAFPPCQFSLDRIRRITPNLNDDGLKDDHLVIAVVKGAI